jgi:hypothetical protein
MGFAFGQQVGRASGLGGACEYATEAADAGSLDSMIWLAHYDSDGKLREPNFFLATKYGQWSAQNGRPETLKEVQRRKAVE